MVKKMLFLRVNLLKTKDEVFHIGPTVTVFIVNHELRKY